MCAEYLDNLTPSLDSHSHSRQLYMLLPPEIQLCPTVTWSLPPWGLCPSFMLAQLDLSAKVFWCFCPSWLPLTLLRAWETDFWLSCCAFQIISCGSPNNQPALTIYRGSGLRAPACFPPVLFWPGDLAHSAGSVQERRVCEYASKALDCDVGTIPGIPGFTSWLWKILEVWSARPGSMVSTSQGGCGN